MKLLLTGAFRATEKQIESLEALGFDVTFLQDEREPVAFDVSEIEAVICNSLFQHTPIEAFNSLRFIQLTAAGLDRVPLDYIKQHGIQLFNARGVYSAPMAELAVSGVLQLYKNAKFFFENQKAHRWEKCRELLELTGKRVLIVGAGSIGTETAKRFRAFDTEVVGVDLDASPRDGFEHVYGLEALDAQLALADVIVLTLPLTDDTMGMFDENRFALMKSTAVFVNIARGGLVRQPALIAALQSNAIRGAVLDVFDEEPLAKDSPLWEMDNVILTPHNSFAGEYNNDRLFRLICRNLKENLL